MFRLDMFVGKGGEVKYHKAIGCGAFSQRWHCYAHQLGGAPDVC